MNLTLRIALRLSMAMIPLMALWTACFYFAMVGEINDETDDALEAYSEMLIVRHLAGEELPPLNNGSNNSYQLHEIAPHEAIERPQLTFHDEMICIPERMESEPARVLTTYFQTPEGVWLELQVATPTFERDDLRETILGWIVFLYLILLVTGVLLTMWVFNRSMSPLYKLLRWLDGYLPGRSIEAVPNESNITEFRRLSEATQKMANRAEELYERQKQFVGNASHELQTPLAVLGNRMEWMIDSMALNEEQMAEVMRMLQTQRQLVRLNRNLLMLTKIENGQFPESKVVDLVELIRYEQDILGEIYEARQIECRMTLPERFDVEMNESLASVLITNLLRNAYLHSADGTTIEVRLEQRTLLVTNAGDTPLDGDRIFERFYQGSKHEGSVGLGLALVRAIAEAYRLTVRYAYSDAKHCFTVIWP